jgi:hypothetical protein
MKIRPAMTPFSAPSSYKRLYAKIKDTVEKLVRWLSFRLLLFAGALGLGVCPSRSLPEGRV